MSRMFNADDVGVIWQMSSFERGFIVKHLLFRWVHAYWLLTEKYAAMYGVCGVPILNVDQVPRDWKNQLVSILDILRSYDCSQ